MPVVYRPLPQCADRAPSAARRSAARVDAAVRSPALFARLTLASQKTSTPTF